MTYPNKPRQSSNTHSIRSYSQYHASHLLIALLHPKTRLSVGCTDILHHTLLLQILAIVAKISLLSSSLHHYKDNSITAHLVMHLMSSDAD